MLRILHTSDLHGVYEPLLAFNDDFDVWLDTGDFFPNFGRLTSERIDPEAERQFQSRWLERTELLERLHDWLGGRSAISVSGNHDFLALAAPLRDTGADAHCIATDGIRVSGCTWAGFREVPWMDGEWEGEVRDLTPFVDAAFAADPDILATHAPPYGILDGAGLFGAPELTEALMHREHRIRAHFFGHEHDGGGQWAQLGDTLYVNGSLAIVVVSMSVPEWGVQ